MGLPYNYSTSIEEKLISAINNSLICEFFFRRGFFVLFVRWRVCNLIVKFHIHVVVLCRMNLTRRGVLYYLVLYILSKLQLTATALYL